MKVKNHIENEYAAGCARVSCGCVAYHGALQYYALQTQQFNTIYLHSDKRFRPFVIDGVAYEYHPLKFTYNVVISKDPEGNPIAVTSLSQTMVDCIRHIDLAGGLEELLYALASISYGQLKEKDMLICLEAYDNASLWSRTGYLLSLHLGIHALKLYVRAQYGLVSDNPDDLIQNVILAVGISGDCQKDNSGQQTSV